eukprot:NODE_3430_length_786_cov_420.560876.p5 GENE.NODE_3430_length_786_cov_420.560876~~NODE_3430_length_786_cov_420.560876.p5  ORF type:complete len:85 (+),score=19.30 NODE_3430_length_786_cov_420.560876:3-257(+)
MGGESPLTSLNRFHEGLGLTGRFCASAAVEHAALLERANSSGLSAKFLQAMFPGRKQVLWLTRDELLAAEEEHQRVGRRSSRRA